MLKEIKEKAKSGCKLFAGALVAALTSAVAVLPVLASSDSTVSYSDFSSIINTITSQVSVSTIVGVIGSITAVCIGLVFFWWAFRKVVKMIMSAFRNGKYSG